MIAQPKQSLNKSYSQQFIASVIYFRDKCTNGYKEKIEWPNVQQGG